MDFGIGEAALAASTLAEGASLAGAGAAGAGAAAAGTTAATTLGLTASQWAALTALAGGATTAAGMAMKPGMPRSSMPNQFDPAAMSRALLPRVRSNAAAATGGGFGEDFLSSLMDQSGGTPGAGLDVIGDIRKGLGP